MNYQDYYAVLGVPRNADDATIKQAYRRLARQYHPDVNSSPGAEKRFKEINEAYTVLGDVAKRRRYDGIGGIGFDPDRWFRGGAHQEPKRQARSPQATEPVYGAEGGNLFSDFFQQLFGGAATQQPRERSAPQGANTTARGHDIGIDITLEEAFHGTRRTIQQGENRFEVTIPPGVDSGTRVRAGSGGKGNLTLVVAVKPHERFTRADADLRIRVKVDLYAALLGGEVHVPTLDGTLALSIPAGTQNGRVFRLQGQGMPRVKEPDRRGDLLVEVDVTLPVPLDAEEERRYEELRRLRQRRTGPFR